MKKKSLLILLPAAVLALGGCGINESGGPFQPDPTPAPVEKTLQSIEVTKLPTKTEYEAGQTFDPTGMEVTAMYSDDTQEEILATEYEISPLTLTTGTTSVTITYEGKTTTVAVTVTGEDPVVNYGTENSPLNATQALSLITAQCVEDDSFTQQKIYCEGEVKGAVQSFDYGADGLAFEFTVTDGTSDVHVYRVHTKDAELGAKVKAHATVKFVGYGNNNVKKNQGLCFADKQSDQVTLISVVPSEKVVSSVAITASPETVYQNHPVNVDDVKVTVTYNDGTSDTEFKPESVRCETGTIGSSTLYATYGGVESAEGVAIQVVEAPTNQFIEAFQAGLKAGSSETSEYTFSGTVVGLRGDDTFVQYENYGIDVYKSPTKVAVGDKVTVVSTLQNFKGLVETKTIKSVNVTGTETLPTPVEITSASTFSLTNQGVLCNVTGTVAEKPTASTSADCTLKLNVEGGTVSFFVKKATIGNMVDTLNSLEVGDSVTVGNGVTSIYNNPQVTGTTITTLTKNGVVEKTIKSVDSLVTEGLPTEVIVNGTIDPSKVKFNVTYSDDTKGVEQATRVELDSSVASATPVKATAYLEVDGQVVGSKQFDVVVKAPSTEITTIEKTTSELIEENSWAVSSGSTIAGCYLTFDLDNVISVVGEGEPNCGSVWGTSPANDYRLYQAKGGAISIVAASGYTIKSINLEFNISNGGTLLNGSTAITSKSDVTVNADSIRLVVGNSGTATNGQIKIKAFKVVYAAK